MILLAYGTRPEWIKIKPLIEELKKNNFEYQIIFTGQHQDLVQFECDWRFDIEDGPNRLDSIVKSLMNRLPIIKEYHKVTHVLVQGDTTSALALALSAFHNNIKVIHLEAGLRTYDRHNPYPEEINRRIISQIADVHFCPTKQTQKNLIDEEIFEDNYLVGNTVIDNLLEYKDKCAYGNNILVTLHRRENHHWMDRWFTAVNTLAKKYPEFTFILPLHPNPNVQKHRSLLTDVVVMNPLPYEKLLDILIKTRLVITDSGGLQEECSFFNKKCLVCRKITERPEVVGKSSFMIFEPEELEEVFIKHIDNYEIDYKCPYGDGHSAKKITQILKEIIE